MKKALSLLIAILLLLTLVACELASADDESTTSPQQETTESPEKSTELDKAETTEKNQNSDNVASEFTEVIVVDNENCMIKITEISDSFFGFALKVKVENKSADKTYMFSVDEAAINGVQCTALFATEVAPGKKSNDDITFFLDDHEDEIGKFTDIELHFRVYDSNDWLADDVAEVTVHVYPFGEDASVKYEREIKDTDKIIVDNEHVTVIVIGFIEDDIWGYTAEMLLINKTDKTLMFSIDDASVNGYMIDPFYATSVMPGKCIFSSVSWSDDALAENEITEVEEIEFKLRAYDYDDLFSNDIINEVITLNP